MRGRSAVWKAARGERLGRQIIVGVQALVTNETSAPVHCQAWRCVGACCGMLANFCSGGRLTRNGTNRRPGIQHPAEGIPPEIGCAVETAVSLFLCPRCSEILLQHPVHATVLAHCRDTFVFPFTAKHSHLRGSDDRKM